MSGSAFRGLAVLLSAVLAAPVATGSGPAMAQTAAPPPIPAAAGATDTTAQLYNKEQLDALMAPVALYPDTLLTQMMMASTLPVQVMQARLWLDNPANKDLKGDALAKALETQSWDPSVKSLVPFPQVLVMMADKADWMQQLGYAVSVQQADVLDSVQRLRRQAQQAGSLTTTPQQTVTMTASTQPGAPPVVVVEPTNPQIVYVPSYNPTQVYGAWPYPATPPVYLPPPPGYAIGQALVTGMAFAAGAAIVGSLWNVGRCNWGGGNVNVNVNRYNNINVNRTQINNANWRPPAGGGGYNRPGGGPQMRPPGGPVGMPNRGNGLPANAIGRPSVSVPSGAVNRPVRPPGAQTGGPVGAPGGGINRPNPPAGAAGRPSLPNGGARPAPGGGGMQRPATPPAANRPAPRPAPAPAALGGIREGHQAPAYANRGAQSRNPGGGGHNAGAGGGAGARAAHGGGGGGGRRH